MHNIFQKGLHIRNQHEILIKIMCFAPMENNSILRLIFVLAGRDR